MTRRIALACLTPRTDGDEHGGLALPSYGIRRIQAAVVGDMLRPDHVVRLFERAVPDVAGYVADILAFEPDILGLSIYVWSTDCMVAVARAVKQRRPQCLIVFGGPSARSAVFDLAYYRDPNTYMDVMVEGDGELIFRDIARLGALTRSALDGIGGLTFPEGEGWRRTVRPNLAPALDMMPSAFQLGLMPPGSIAYLETFRGCPLSCRFCEWGVMDKEQGVFSSAYIARELRAFRRAEAPAIFLLDAGLNLNAKAFRNLREAASETGAMAEIELWAEIYPASIRPEHLDFLQEIGPTYLGVGMQSMDPAVLKLHQRQGDGPRFEESVRRLAAVTTVELQIIMGAAGGYAGGVSPHAGVRADVAGERAGVSLPGSAGCADDAGAAAVPDGVRSAHAGDGLVPGVVARRHPVDAPGAVAAGGAGRWAGRHLVVVVSATQGCRGRARPSGRDVGMRTPRSGRRVALLARYPDHDPAMPQRIPNLGMRMVEATLRAARFPGLEVRVWDLEPAGLGVEAVARQVAAFDPDVVGFSAFLWSFPFFLLVAALLKQDDPERLVVFGGPSARPVMLEHTPHDALAGAVDVLVINEGEETFRDIVGLTDRSAGALMQLPGVAVRCDGRWKETKARPLGDLNLLPSPYDMSLVPPGGLGIMQTYRGCPFTCSFCEWGTLESPKRVRDVDSIATEFRSMARIGLGATLLADAGLNLNNGAFQNLRAAADATGFLERRGLICEVYPATVRPDHLAFLRGVGNPYVGVGLQSFDTAVLAGVERKYDEARFEQTLGR